MFAATSMNYQEKEREIDAQTTSSWLGAGIYVPPKDFPELMERSIRSKESRGSKGSKSDQRGSSLKGADEVLLGSEDLKFDGGNETNNALVLTSTSTTPPRGANAKKSQSPTSIVEEQLRTLQDSFAKTLFGCSDDETILANAEENAKKNTRSYQRDSQNKVSRNEDKLTPNLSLFHTFGATCACIAETNAPGLAKMISGQSVVGFEEKKEDESVANRMKKPKKRSMASKPKQAVEPTNSQTLIPMEELIVDESSPHEVSRGVSELTMRSSYARVHAPLPAQRRMAYYAVGRHNKPNSRGGNRRCYYSGKLIVGDNPYYAGCVKQGLRTLVVFCLPSALGLPKKEVQEVKAERKPSFVKGILTRSSSRFSSNTSTTSSDSTSFVGMEGDDEDVDVNSRLDKDYLLSVLPEPSDELMVLMQQKYPSDFRTLPDQVRKPDAWKIYIQFCFFSGLPIAEGECYYKIKSEISNEQYGESIVLCHAIMEAVNGSSSDMVRLPNLKTFQYLKKHYPQQSEKLPSSVFERSSWEVVLPEI